MSIRNFKQLFSAVFVLVLGGVGLMLGLNAKALPLVGILRDFRELVETRPFYYQSMIVALTTVGVLFGAIIGPKVAQSIVNAGNAIERMSTRDKVGVGCGTVIGVIVTLLIFLPLLRVPVFGAPLGILLGVIFVYLGIRGMLSMAGEFRFLGSSPPIRGQIDGELSMERCKILDTNVIIDGRIIDVCRTGFIEGTIYVPGFVLDELQHIADSSDSLKRARGRRGLDILNAMQKEFALVVRSHDHKIGGNSAGDEVDTRLVKLAKALNGDIVTNDFNLNKVAALQGVTVLNVNELANALKPVVLPGEEMPVMIIKEGKEPNQGVAYLDDGTMIVIEDGRRHIGENLPVIVTSVLQTVAGKMIFATIKQNDDGSDEENGDRHDDSHGYGGPRGYSGGRPRRPLR